MTSETDFSKNLNHPGTIVLPGNRCLLETLETNDWKANQQPSGHTVYYGPHGRRVLLTDPEGHPLHECEWTHDEHGRVKLIAARMYLDWGQWVGIKPEGLINSTSFDLSKRPGWERLSRDDLRLMVSHALKVPVKEVEFFYEDDDLLISSSGMATIRQRKDALYVLPDGTFEHAKFMSCMGAMHWERIDFLPVVELFLSLLQGTGNATFELIRGLYDDQNPESPLPLVYRGIPTYPSEAAYGLFSAFFTPSCIGSGSPLALFMDPTRSSEVTWRSKPDPPLRYIASEHHFCLTLVQGSIQKVTRVDDPTGLPFFKPNPQGFVPCGKAFDTKDGFLVLKDFQNEKTFPLPSSWEIRQNTGQSGRMIPETDWREFFEGSAPEVAPREAFSTVLLYPEDDTEIGELESQPFLADYLEDILEENPFLSHKVGASSQVMIENFDAVIGTCLSLDRPRNYTIVFSRQAFAQKHAQSLWNRLTRSSQLDWSKKIRFFPRESYCESAYQQAFDLLYVWLPMSDFDRQDVLARILSRISHTLQPNGLAFIAGPHDLSSHFDKAQLEIIHHETASNLPTFHMHRSILPRAKVNERLTLWILRRTT